MNDWGSILYHSISIANGGRDIINFYSNSTIYINHIQEEIIQESNEIINNENINISDSKLSNSQSSNSNFESSEDYNKENIFIRNSSSNISPMKNINVTLTPLMKKRIFEDITDRYINLNNSFDEISFDESSPLKSFIPSPLFYNNSINIDNNNNNNNIDDIKPLKMFPSMENKFYHDVIDDLNTSNGHDSKDSNINEFDQLNQTIMIEVNIFINNYII
jgi:hypothetical protein